VAKARVDFVAAPAGSQEMAGHARTQVFPAHRLAIRHASGTALLDGGVHEFERLAVAEREDWVVFAQAV
jgi:hypothetical protein